MNAAACYSGDGAVTYRVQPRPAWHRQAPGCAISLASALGNKSGPVGRPHISKRMRARPVAGTPAGAANLTRTRTSVSVLAASS